MENVFEIYIKTTPERLWQAITDPAMRAKYTFGLDVVAAHGTSRVTPMRGCTAAGR